MIFWLLLLFKAALLFAYIFTITYLFFLCIGFVLGLPVWIALGVVYSLKYLGELFLKRLNALFGQSYEPEKHSYPDSNLSNNKYDLQESEKAQQEKISYCPPPMQSQLIH